MKYTQKRDIPHQGVSLFVDALSSQELQRTGVG
jgi:hypothetical protein